MWMSGRYIHAIQSMISVVMVPGARRSFSASRRSSAAAICSGDRSARSRTLGLDNLRRRQRLLLGEALAQCQYEFVDLVIVQVVRGRVEGEFLRQTIAHEAEICDRVLAEYQLQCGLAPRLRAARHRLGPMTERVLENLPGELVANTNGSAKR